MRSRIWRYALGLVAVMPLIAGAQSSSSRTSFGLLGAVNVATLGGSDATGLGNRVAFSAGGFVRIALNPSWSFQPELEYAAKGAQATSNSAGYLTVGTLDLRYLEIPLLFRVTATSSPSVRLYGELGPAFAVELDCTITGAGAGVSVSESCSDYSSVSSFDVGAMVGGGFEFPIDTHSLSLGVRYNYGLTDIATDTDAKNRNLQFVAGLRF